MKSCCANCGKTASDDIKLRNCAACHLVSYCSVNCQKEHRPKHKRACKTRAAEIRDERLFKQPEGSHLGDCPICFEPMSLDVETYSTMMACCGKCLCSGCYYEHFNVGHRYGTNKTCPFCRKEAPDNKKDRRKRYMERIKMNDPEAMHDEGLLLCERQDYGGAMKYFSKAAELGNVAAHYELGIMYLKGEGVEKSMPKALKFFEEAAIGGHPAARFNLGGIERSNRRYDRAVRHYIIAAKLGYDRALDALKIEFKRGVVSKDDFTAALRGHHDAVTAMKSPQREAGCQKLALLK